MRGKGLRTQIVHPEQDPMEVQFGMKVIKFTQSSFECQIGE